MMVLGAAARIGTRAALVVGMYVMGRNVVGQDWFPGEVVAATSWKFASCWGWSPVAAVALMMVAFATSAVVVLVVGFEACDDCWMGCEGRGAALTWKEETGMVKVCTRSGDCWTGEVAVWAVFCFSRLRHFARLF